MEKYDTSRVNEELKKELDGAGSNLKSEVENLVKQFTAYESQVEVYEAQNAEAVALTEKLKIGVDQLNHAISMIREILYADATDAEKVKLLKAQVKAPGA